MGQNMKEVVVIMMVSRAYSLVKLDAGSYII
jgi:hypothetical protein